MLVGIDRETWREKEASSSSPTSVMEKLQGLINPYFFGDHLDSQCIDQGFTTTTNGLRFEEQEAQEYLSGLKVRMPLLQMLQTIDHFPHCEFTAPKEPTFQALLRLQQAVDPLESCVTHQEQYLHNSPRPKSEVQDNPHQNNDPLSVSTTTLEGHGGLSSSDCNQLNSTKMCPKKSASTTRERRKRKRTRPTKNKEEVESQRMTHIAVERNRRRQMNDHLNVLRSLMPPSYIQRGDQASIVGGAIDFVKELEHHLQTLEAQKRMTKAYNNVDDPNNNKDSMTTTSSSSLSSMSTMPSNGMFMSLSQCRIGSTTTQEEVEVDVTALNNSEAAEVDVTVIQNHVNLKVECQKRPGQLMRALVAFEDIIRLTVLHLNITTSSDDKVLYCFNLKIEEGCKLGSADEIAKAVHQIISFIN